MRNSDAELIQQNLGGGPTCFQHTCTEVPKAYPRARMAKNR